jgi:manganese/zinc/iron transport system permease protein
MTAFQAMIETYFVMIAAAGACSLLGPFLVLRRMAMQSDAIGHVLLPGIVIAFFLVGSLKSPWLIFGAALSGLLTVALTETLQKTRFVKADAAIGLIFPILFSVGVLLITLYARNVHLDVDRVLTGSPELAVGSRVIIGDRAYGCRALWWLVGVGVANALFLWLFWKELKLVTFDGVLATTMGFSPAILNYALMGFVSLTAVAAFEAVGPALVVAYLVVPAATAYLLTDSLLRMTLYSLLFAVTGAVGGAWVAYEFGLYIAGTAAVMLGLQFAIVLLLAPDRGLISQWRQERIRRRRFHALLVVVHLQSHEGTPVHEEESRWSTLHEHFRWSRSSVERAANDARQWGWVRLEGDRLELTDFGRITGDEIDPTRKKNHPEETQNSK